jgi:hypothetical protein
MIDRDVSKKKCRGKQRDYNNYFSIYSDIIAFLIQDGDLPATYFFNYKLTILTFFYRGFCKKPVFTSRFYNFKKIKYIIWNYLIFRLNCCYFPRRF